MHWNDIAYDKHSCAMHWDCIANNKHHCAIHWDCIAYDAIEIYKQCNGMKLLIISVVVQCIRKHCL